MDGEALNQKGSYFQRKCRYVLDFVDNRRMSSWVPFESVDVDLVIHSILRHRNVD